MSGQLTIYSTPWCGYCTRLKRQLDRENVTYTDVDITDDAESTALVMKINGGNQTVPTVVYPDGSSATNPSLQDVLAAVR